jgi:hypothetical protein
VKKKCLSLGKKIDSLSSKKIGRVDASECENGELI